MSTLNDAGELNGHLHIIYYISSSRFTGPGYAQMKKKKTEKKENKNAELRAQ